MRAVRNTDDGIAAVDVPEPVGDGVVVRPVSVGICGSDLHMIDLGHRGVTLGHEVCAIHEGRLVGIQPMAFCGRCERCVEGDSHLCTAGHRAIYGGTVDGGLADELLIDAQCIVELPDGMTPQTAALIEPVAVGIHALNKVPLVPGMRMAVIGAGTVGLIAGAVARDRGAIVDVAHRHPGQMEAAERLGLGTALGDDYDIVVDAAGTDASVARAVSVVRPGGTMVVPAIFWGDVTLPGLEMCMKELDLITTMLWGHHHGERETDLAARLLAQLPDLPEALVTHRFPLERAPEAFAAAADRAAGAIKVAIDVQPLHDL